MADRDFLEHVARDTWRFFEEHVDPVSGLPVERLLESESPTQEEPSSGVNIGLYLMSIVSANDLGLIDRRKAVSRIQKTLSSLSRMETVDGNFYNSYDPRTLSPLGSYLPAQGVPDGQYHELKRPRRGPNAEISSESSAWIAAGLMVAREAFDEVKPAADTILARFSFSLFFDHSGYHRALDAKNGIWPYMQFYLLPLESRIVPFLAISRGQILWDWWFRLRLTAPKHDEWKKEMALAFGARPNLEPPAYSYRDIEIAPSWGGSLREFLMPTLVLDEQALAPRGLGLNNLRTTDAHVRYALEEKGYPVWGIGTCAPPENPADIRDYGVPPLGVHGFPDEGVITPHVSFLALAVDPSRAVENIRRLSQLRGLYGSYGFRDSVHVKSGRVGEVYRSPHQGIVLTAINNHLNNGAVRRRFQKNPAVARHLFLLRKDAFFEPAQPVGNRSVDRRRIREQIVRFFETRKGSYPDTVIPDFIYDSRGRPARREDFLRGIQPQGMKADPAIRFEFLKTDVAVAWFTVDKDYVGVFVKCAPDPCGEEWRWTGLWPAGAAGPGTLDGTQWLSGPEDSPRTEKIVFADQKVVVGTPVQRGFFPSPYTSRQNGEDLMWSTEMLGTVSAVTRCVGQVTGDQMKVVCIKYAIEDKSVADVPMVWKFQRK